MIEADVGDNMPVVTGLPGLPVEDQLCVVRLGFKINLNVFFLPVCRRGVSTFMGFCR